MTRNLYSFLSAATFCLAATPLPAHSEKGGTTPANGAQLTETPEMIHMVFADPTLVTMVRLLKTDGTDIPMVRGTGLEPSLEFHAVPENLMPGSYTVKWRGLASDGHAMQGSFSFEIAD